jgi:ArsR family transcriptional regulator, arsenate/arsenite/antimonite-responsive transcriptional repressor
MKTKEDKLVRISKALADKARLRILAEIAKKKGITCNEVIKNAGLSQSTVSHHLKILNDSELLNSVKSGRYSILSVNLETLNEFKSMLSDIIRTQKFFI